MRKKFEYFLHLYKQCSAFSPIYDFSEAEVEEKSEQGVEGEGGMPFKFSSRY